MQELTSYQRNQLFTLVEYQNKQDGEVIFSTNNSGKIKRYAPSIQPDPPVIVETSTETFELWGKNEFIHITNHSGGSGPFTYDFQTFILRQEAFNYYKHMNTPPFIRGLINLGNRLIDDIPSLIWGVIGGALSAILIRVLGF